MHRSLAPSDPRIPVPELVPQPRKVLRNAGMPSRVGASEPNQEQPDTSRAWEDHSASSWPRGCGEAAAKSTLGDAQSLPWPLPGERGQVGTLLPILDCGTRLHFFHANLFIPII